MELLFLALLILLNGVFAMSEMAVVSARKTRLQQWADEGSQSAAAALTLANEPGRFLSTIQVGITTIGILSGAIAEAAVSQALAAKLAQVSLLAPYSQAAATAVVVVTITYLSVVVGELVPKRLALINAEVIASAIARPMQWLARVSFPLVRFFNLSSEAVLRLLGSREGGEPPVTEEEIKVLMEQGTEAGVFEESEQTLVSNILRLDEQRVGAIMTPRVDIFYLDLEEPYEDNKEKLLGSPYSRMPVCRDGLDNVIGILESKALVRQILRGEAIDFASLLERPLYVPNSISSMELLETFKKNRVHIALVVDEYGEIQGLVTMNDVLEAIVGDIASDQTETDPDAVQREDGSWLLDGMLSLEKFKEIFEIEELEDEDKGNFHTLGGFVMLRLGRVPVVADKFEWDGLRFEVMDMDRHRVDKMLVSRLPNPNPPEEASPGEE
ncbi:MAG TPA: hemolysin family protein [Burkholderiales bacterium]|nr:hemolysin family protein [Burkholderiales bacterium]